MRGPQLYLDPSICIFCQICGSEIPSCIPSVRRTKDRYGAILCARCRDKREVLTDVKISDIKNRIVELQGLMKELLIEQSNLEKELDCVLRSEKS